MRVRLERQITSRPVLGKLEREPPLLLGFWTKSPSPAPAFRSSDGSPRARSASSGRRGRSAAVGLDGGDPGPPVGQVVRLGRNAQTSCGGASSSRLPRTSPAEELGDPLPEHADQAAQLGEAAIATTTAPSPATASATRARSRPCGSPGATRPLRRPGSRPPSAASGMSTTCRRDRARGTRSG